MISKTQYYFKILDFVCKFGGEGRGGIGKKKKRKEQVENIDDIERGRL